MTDLRSQLQTIYDERGRLTPALVVEAAREDDHPLHPRFEWDDAVAGHKYRLVQAHELIRSVRVAYRSPTSSEPSEVRAFHAVRRPEGHVYVPVERVAEDEVTRRIVLADMEREWRQLHGRYERFAEFTEMVHRDLAPA